MISTLFHLCLVCGLFAMARNTFEMMEWKAALRAPALLLTFGLIVALSLSPRAFMHSSPDHGAPDLLGEAISFVAVAYFSLGCMAWLRLRERRERRSETQPASASAPSRSVRS